MLALGCLAKEPAPDAQATPSDAPAAVEQAEAEEAKDGEAREGAGRVQGQDRAGAGDFDDEAPAEEDAKPARPRANTVTEKKESAKPRKTLEDPAPEADSLAGPVGGLGLDANDPLAVELLRLEGRMREAGLRPPADAALSKDDANRFAAARAQTSCDTLCDLREAICGLETKICTLAEGKDEAKYDNACVRARGDCRVATQACESCSE